MAPASSTRSFAQRPQSALAERREVGPVELEDVDRTIISAPAQRSACGLVQGFTFGQRETPEQIVVQREAEITRARVRGRDDRNRLLRLIEPAWRSRPPPRRFGLAPVVGRSLCRRA